MKHVCKIPNLLLFARYIRPIILSPEYLWFLLEVCRLRFSISKKRKLSRLIRNSIMALERARTEYNIKYLFASDQKSIIENICVHVRNICIFFSRKNTVVCEYRQYYVNSQDVVQNFQFAFNFYPLIMAQLRIYFN